MGSATESQINLPNFYRISVRVVLKALILFIIANIIFAVFYPLHTIGKISLYNHLFPGRERLPYGDDPARSYNLSPLNLEAMFASHEIDGQSKSPDEFRVLLIGDSQTWGYLLKPDQTLSAALNDPELKLPDGRTIKVFNLAYPVMSLTKDLLLLSKAMEYQPDMIIWLVTLESFPNNKQLFPPIVQHNPDAVRKLIENYDLNLDPQAPELIDKSPWQRTIIGSRRDIADWLRLQILGVLWAATGIDQDIPQEYTPRMENLPADDNFYSLQSPLTEGSLAMDILQSGIEMAGNVPVLIVNEPMFISRGENSDIRYNFYYPRWAYDEYRQFLATRSAERGWNYLDLWNAIPETEFTNTAVHLTENGVDLLSGRLRLAILELAGSQP